MKKLLSILLAVIILSSALIIMPTTVSAESLYIRKIVSVVYDDSSSMYGEKWAYANYAMQVFCGMLNDEDQLYVTYMSTITTVGGTGVSKQIGLSKNEIQGSVDSIRKHTETWGTPYAAVTTAYNKLKSIDDSNPNTQYWLVVITDGDYTDESVNKNELNKRVKSYTETTMPNGTKPQVTYLGIGNVTIPDADHSKGIYTYTASSADKIIGAMSDMADRISGRTRLQKSDITKVNSNTIQVSSAIPLLNIAAFVQGSTAKVTSVEYSNEVAIPVSRSVSLKSPSDTKEVGYKSFTDLVGGAFLIGDSQQVIGSGTYNITFDRSVDVDDVVVLLEPALEARMTLKVNGKEVDDINDLDDLMENDKVAVSYRIYEMGTDKEVDPSLMPPGTRFEISVYEDGKLVEKATGDDMALNDYVLKNVDTKISAAVIIEGFNPIDYTVEFTPVKYVPRIVYTLEASYGSDVKSVKLDNIANNKDLTVCFTVLADGVPMTDPAAVKALNPAITVSPAGNSGTITYSSDGKIVFTPNTATASTAVTDSFDVDVTCTLEDGTSDSLTYTVLIATYEVIPVSPKESVKKTDLYGNEVAVSFYITKDGVKLDKEAVEKQISVLLNKAHSKLTTSVSVSADGTITVTPYSENKHTLNFWNWWTNWAYYFGLTGKDITVTMSHAYGTASGTVNITEQTLSYQIFNVYIPLIIEIILLAILTTWIILVVTKPRYNKSATLYAGTIKYNSDNFTHVVRDFAPVKLDKFNKIKRGNGRLKFKRTADVVNAGGIKIRADHGGRIICEMILPWYKGRLEPYDSDVEGLKTPADISEYLSKHKRLEVNEFVMTEKINGDYEKVLAPVGTRSPKYIVIPETVGDVDDRKVIKSGKIFIYTNQ